jgi:hypothetical protein
LEGAPSASGASALEEDSVEAAMANVEEMLEGYEWASGGVIGTSGPGRSRGAADQIEARLLNELMALEKVFSFIFAHFQEFHCIFKANIHSFLETDDRIATVLKFVDDAITELNSLDGQVTSYKIQLNVRSHSICIKAAQFSCLLGRRG